jgi:polar amino acid transport system substrate-binding protein
MPDGSVAQGKTPHQRLSGHRRNCRVFRRQYKCQKFFFSDPFYESVVLFVRNDAGFAFEKNDELRGKTLCRPKGWSTYELDKSGRNWLKDGKITLIQPPTVEECFRLLDETTVDAVVVAELSGEATAAAMGMSDRVHPATRPLNIETMHVIVAKTHPDARTLLYYVNSSLARLRETGAYDGIVAKHLELFWNSIGRGIRPLPHLMPNLRMRLALRAHHEIE